jgi:hypothetical protein
VLHAAAAGHRDRRLRARARCALGFGPVLSLTVCLVLVVHTFESRLLPLASACAARWRWLGAARSCWSSCSLASRAPLARAWGSLHWVLGVGSYGLFGAAVLHGRMLDSAERRLRLRKGLHRALRAAAAAARAADLPLREGRLRGARRWPSLLGRAHHLGLALGPQDRAVAAELGDLRLAAGRAPLARLARPAGHALAVRRRGILLQLAYVGSRFVLEVLLERSAA